MKLESYPSIYNIGHKATTNLFLDDVVIEEKLDGSQFSFALVGGKVAYNSKNCVINPKDCNKLFAKAVQFIEETIVPRNILEPEVIYRGEAISKPNHNTLTYSRAPEAGFVLFDIQRSGQNFLPYNDKLDIARQLGVELVPLLAQGKYNSWEELKPLLDRESFLGGCKIEGFVVKNYSRFGIDKKILMGKYVSEEFKEKHGSAWQIKNPKRTDIINSIITEYAIEGRFNKAIEHLNAEGLLEGSAKDIGLLMKEISCDVQKEESERIKDALFNHFWKDIIKGITRGVPNWYKEKLAKDGFNEY